MSSTPEPTDPATPSDSDEAEQHVRQIMEPSQQASDGPVPTDSPGPKPVSAPPLDIFEDKPRPEDIPGPTDMPAAVAKSASTGDDPSTDDPTEDQAVDDIVRSDADEVLHEQDAAAAEAFVMKPSFKERFKNGLHDWWDNPKKRYGTLAGIIIVLGVLAAVPFTRYAALGLFLKKQITVAVVDDKTGTPVSGALVQAGGKQAKTEANGKATLTVRLGSVALDATKKYYRSYSHNLTVTLSEQHNSFKVSLRALGRQVPVKVINKVTGKPLAGAVVNLQGSEAKTDKNGKANVVLASSATSQKASVSLGGYNTTQVVVTAGDNMLAKNTFSLTPSGKIYFLSNQSGKIDVVKTNLDGTDRQTVLAGTGSEDPNSTSLLASRDWKYLALLAKRGGNSPSVYLIDTTNGDKLTAMDQGDASFSLVGWSGDTFVYEVNRNNIQNWQPNAHALKSYDATSGKLTLLDQTIAEGTSDSDYGNTFFSSVYILDNELFYAKNWNSSYYTNHLAGKTDSLESIRPDGSGHRDVKDFPIPTGLTYYSLNLSLYEPYGVYVQVPGSGGATNAYYEYENGALTAKPSVTDATFNSQYSTYLISPSSSYTFWTEQRDGKNTLFVGDKDAANQKQIASLSEYKPYGWYSDDYLLVSKSSSELYIMPKGGSGAPVKISDYYKPPINYNGYGGGYGGL